VADQEGGDEEEQEGQDEGQGREEVWVETDEGVDGDEGEGLRRLAPGKEPAELGLKDEDRSDPTGEVSMVPAQPG
jgi:hypothetical protein